MKIIWNEVTWYSKLTTLVVFILTVAAGVWIALQYKYANDQYKTALSELNSMPPLQPHKAPADIACGGLIRNAPECPANYHCVLGSIPDKGGICVKD